MFKVKNVDLTVFTEFTNSWRADIREEDGYPIDLSEWGVSGYIYEPYDTISGTIHQIGYDEPTRRLVLDDSVIEGMDIMKVYKYKVFAEAEGEKHLVQFGSLFIFDEYRNPQP